MIGPGADVPPELFAHIVGSVRDTKTLLSCCLVSTGWNRTTIPFLHKSITLSQNRRQYDLLEIRLSEHPELTEFTTELVVTSPSGSINEYSPFLRVIRTIAPYVVTIQFEGKERYSGVVQLLQEAFPAVRHMILHTTSARFLEDSYCLAYFGNYPALARISVYNANDCLNDSLLRMEACTSRESPCVNLAIHDPFYEVFTLDGISRVQSWELPWSSAAAKGLTLSWTKPWSFHCPPHSTLCCFHQRQLGDMDQPFRPAVFEYLCPGSKAPQFTAPGMFSDFLRSIIHSLEYFELSSQLKGRKDLYIDFLLRSPDIHLSFASLRVVYLKDTRRGPRSCVAGLSMLDVLQHLAAPCLEEVTLTLVFFPHHKRGLMDVFSDPRWKAVDTLYARTTSTRFPLLGRFMIVYEVPMPTLFPEWRQMALQSDQRIHDMLLTLFPSLLSAKQLVLSHTAY